MIVWMLLRFNEAAVKFASKRIVKVGVDTRKPNPMMIGLLVCVIDQRSSDTSFSTYIPNKHGQV